MSAGNVKACQSCRTAKTKCDQSRPTCGRCQRLHITCTGYTADIDFVFRSENAAAKRNSQQARKASRPVDKSLVVRPRGRQSASSSSSSSRSGGSSHRPVVEGEISTSNSTTDDESIPRSVSTPVVDRVVDRWLQDWVIIPTRQGRQAGQMLHVVALYLSSPPNSAFSTAIQALAFAHLKHENKGSFSLKAKATYGKALMCMKDEVADKGKIRDDRLLAALLLLDNFEILHLNKRDALGPHSDGVKHILAHRGEHQFSGGHSFAMWRIAHHRLLGRQIYERTSPDPAQIKWMMSVKIDRPDLHLSVNSMQMSILIGRATALLRGAPDLEPEERAKAAQQLVTEMTEVIAEMHSWLSCLPAAWIPKQRNGYVESEPVAYAGSDVHGPLRRSITIYFDVWLAYMLDFRSATEIVLREMLIELLFLIEGLSDDADSTFLQACVEHEIEEIKRLSNALVDQFPLFKDIALNTGKAVRRSFTRPELSGRFHALFAMVIIARADYAPTKDKIVANWVSESVKADYQLP